MSLILLKKNMQTRKKAQGFTLIEVMVAFFILGVGLLGMASLFSAGTKANQNAYFRTQAIALVQDMADRMRANPSGNYLLAAAGNGACYATAVDAAGCGVDEMAKNDLFQWNASIGRLLPAGVGVVCNDDDPGVGTVDVAACDGADPLVFAIRVGWDGDRDGQVDQTFVMRMSR